MSKNLRKCMATMHLYCNSDCPKLKRSILSEMSKQDCFFRALFEIINNIHLKNISLDKLKPNEKKKAKKFATIMNKIHNQPRSKVKRRKLVKQTGGFIQFILPVLTSVVSELISNVVS